MLRATAILALLLLSGPLVKANEKEHVFEINDHQIYVKITESYDQTPMVRAECVIPRLQRVIWEVLSDYDNLEGIVPAVTDSRILRKEGKQKILYQEGRAGIWIFKRDFAVTFRVEEVPMSYIGFDAFEGDFNKFKGSWQIAQRETGTWVSHRVEIEPRFFAPKWALRMMARKLMIETIENVIAHCLATEASPNR
jgi:ribosome-associated toxin RatA of RatAB toxin-antitoxin module